MIYICDSCSEDKDSQIDGYFENERYYSCMPELVMCEKCIDKSRYSQELLNEMGA